MKTKARIRRKRAASPELRETICVFRGLPEYRSELREAVRRVNQKGEAKVRIEKLLERGVTLALAELGEPAITSPRLQGRYSNHGVHQL